MEGLSHKADRHDDEPPIGKLDFVTTEDAQTILETLLDTSNSEPFVITISVPYSLLDEVIDGVTKNTQEALTTRAREIYREMK